jgi:predicted dehydrogenase
MTTAVPVRVGVLSFAHYHANFWSEVLAGRGVLAGIWDTDEARGRDAAERFGTTFDADLDALLARCTAVAVCSETFRHLELIERATARGLAILCEKPLGTSLADCERIAAIVRHAGIVFMQSFPKRFDPVSHRLREWVASGELGRVTLVRVRHGHFYGLQSDFCERWYVDPAQSGGGALLDEGVHGADLLAWLFGLPKSVTATISDAALRLPVEDLGIAVFEFASGLVAELTSSFSFAAADASIELYGTRGTVLVSGVDLASRDITHDGFVRIWRADDAERRWEVVPLTPRFKLGQFHQQNALAFVDCLERGTPPPITIDDGVRAMKMIDAAYVAARTGRRQAIES